MVVAIVAAEDQAGLGSSSSSRPDRCTLPSLAPPRAVGASTTRAGCWTHSWRPRRGMDPSAGMNHPRQRESWMHISPPPTPSRARLRCTQGPCSSCSSRSSAGARPTSSCVAGAAAVRRAAPPEVGGRGDTCHSSAPCVHSSLRSLDSWGQHSERASCFLAREYVLCAARVWKAHADSRDPPHLISSFHPSFRCATWATRSRARWADKRASGASMGAFKFSWVLV